MKKTLTVFVFALAGWALCAAVMAVGMKGFGLRTALIVHAVAAPVIFIQLSFIYFKKFRHTGPAATALIFLGTVVFIDFFLVALAINRSFDMFRSFIGTWLPFILIAVSTYVTGLLVPKKAGNVIPQEKGVRAKKEGGTQNG
jgi:hypothetical protein